jgi:hypothetical protein
MWHWTEHNLHVQAFTCVLALQIAHLKRLKAAAPGCACPSASCSASSAESAKRP